MLSRREFLQVLAVAAVTGMNSRAVTSASADDLFTEKMYDVPAFGNVSLLHITDVHAQLLPVYFREPNVNVGIGDLQGRPPYLVGSHFLKYYGMPENSPLAYAYTYLDFEQAARRYGRLGGYAHLATLVKRLRAQRKNSLLLDGGDNWQGSATALWTNAQDMVDASLLLGVDIMTGHWEFTFGAQRVNEIINRDFKGKLEFLAHNVFDNEFGDSVFKGYTIREMNGVPVAIIGQAFPYTPVANPSFMIPNWSFGIREQELQNIVDEVRGKGAQLVVLLSHNGMSVDLKLASRVSGIDVILGGHTHDAVPKPVEVNNRTGKTLVINSGAAGKFLAVLDMDVRDGKLRDYRFNLLPVFSNLLPPDKTMQDYIDSVRKPFEQRLNEKLALTDTLLYRRGTFNGSFDQLILNAMLESMDAEIAFSPGFRWGMNVLPGEAITYEDVMTQTAITYPMVTLNELSGERIKLILEDVADNIFNNDPYYQQGGDMVRVGGLQYTIDPLRKIGNRISDMKLRGKPIAANKHYRVAGWASINEIVEGMPIWDLVAGYLRDRKTVSVEKINMPIIRNVKNNPSIALLQT